MKLKTHDNKAGIIDIRKLQRFWRGCGPNLREQFVDIETHVYTVFKANGSHGGGSIFITIVFCFFLL